MLGRSAVKARADLAVLSTVRAGSQQSERGSRGQKQATPNERLASRLSYRETSKKESTLFSNLEGSGLGCGFLKKDMVRRSMFPCLHSSTSGPECPRCVLLHNY